jgi:type IV secretory pathway VirB3-like protein
MTPGRRTNPVYKTLNKPLTFLGVERVAFAIVLGAAASFYILFGNPFGGGIIFAILLYFARLLTHKDPNMILFVGQAIIGQFKSYYDPCKYQPLIIRRIRRA